MPIIGFHYDPAGDDAVHFLPPPDRPTELRRIRILLVLAAILSVFSAGANAFLMVDVYSAADLLRKRGEKLIKDPKVLAVIEAEAPKLLEQLAQEQGTEPPTPEEIEQAADMGVDALRMGTVLSGNVMLVLMLLTFYFPVKYVLLYRRAGQGHPESIRVIRATAWAQIAVELFRSFNLFLMNAETAVLKLPNSPSPTLLVAALIVFYIRRERVKEYFSDYKVLPAPPEVVAAWEASQTPAPPAA